MMQTLFLGHFQFQDSRPVTKLGNYNVFGNCILTRLIDSSGYLSEYLPGVCVRVVVIARDSHVTHSLFNFMTH